MAKVILRVHVSRTADAPCVTSVTEPCYVVIVIQLLWTFTGCRPTQLQYSFILIYVVTEFGFMVYMYLDSI